MNELLYSFINQVEDANKINEMSVEEFAKLVRSNQLISEDDAKQLIESFKKISGTKKQDDEDDSNDSDQRKKKYREKHKELTTEIKDKKENLSTEKEVHDDSRER